MNVGHIKKGSLLLNFLVMFAIVTDIHAQEKKDTPSIQIRNNIIYLNFSRDISDRELASFTHRYNLRDIGLYQLVNSGGNDSLAEAGWDTNLSDPQKYTLTKTLKSPVKPVNPSDKIIFYAIPTPDTWRIQGGNRVIYGVNDFKSGKSFSRVGDVVTITLKGYTEERLVRLAGNFTNWQYGAFPMTRSDDGWMIQVKLEPGAWYYKFILGEDHWITDPANNLTENDGRGNINSVFYIPNKSIRLEGYQDARNVFLSGSFNNWVKDQVRLSKKNVGWETEIFLEPGTHRYQFIVDGKAINLNENTEKATAEIGAPHLFFLKGYKNARKVALAGNFNDWEPQQLWMKPTADGWELPYVLGPGNYMYKYIVDGNWITDPALSEVTQDLKGNQNSFLVIKPNFKFRLNGHRNAKEVFVAGDLNEWDENILPMKKVDGVWVADVFLGRGKHKYKFIVDGHPILDPANKLVEDNESGSGNSVIWIE